MGCCPSLLGTAALPEGPEGPAVEAAAVAPPGAEIERHWPGFDGLPAEDAATAGPMALGAPASTFFDRWPADGADASRQRGTKMRPLHGRFKDADATERARRSSRRRFLRRGAKVAGGALTLASGIPGAAGYRVAAA